MFNQLIRGAALWQVATAVSVAPSLAQPYDLLVKGGHVIDAKNLVDGVLDVAIADGYRDAWR